MSNIRKSARNIGQEIVRGNTATFIATNAAARQNIVSTKRGLTAEISSSSVQKDSDILPSADVGDKPYFEIKNKCTGSGYGFQQYMPILTLDKSVVDGSKNSLINTSFSSDSDSFNEVDTGSSQISLASQPNNIQKGLKRVGLVADVTIVKVRKTAWETLAKALEFYATTIKQNITETGIYKNNTLIILFVQASGVSGNSNPKISEPFNLTELGKVFDGAKVDDVEGHMSGGAPLIRDTMKDSNEAMKTVDEAMFKIISILFRSINFL